MTAALERGDWSAAHPGRNLPKGKTRYPFYRRLGGPQRWSGRAENLVPNEIRSRTVQPVVSRYTDWATRRRKAISITYSECLSVALFIQHAQPMHRVLLSSVTCPPLPYFSTLSHKREDFPKKNYWTQNVCFDFIYNSETFLILRRIERDMIKNAHWSFAKYPLL